MLSRPGTRSVLAIGGVAAALAVGACSSGDGGGDDPSDALADRVRAALQADPDVVAERLGEQGLDVGAADLAAADLTCPEVRETAPGDIATCTADIAGRTVAVDVAFGEGGAVTVVAVEAAP